MLITLFPARRGVYTELLCPARLVFVEGDEHQIFGCVESKRIEPDAVNNTTDTLQADQATDQTLTTPPADLLELLDAEPAAVQQNVPLDRQTIAEQMQAIRTAARGSIAARYPSMHIRLASFENKYQAFSQSAAQKIPACLV